MSLIRLAHITCGPTLTDIRIARYINGRYCTDSRHVMTSRRLTVNLLAGPIIPTILGRKPQAGGGVGEAGGGELTLSSAEYKNVTTNRRLPLLIDRKPLTRYHYKSFCMEHT
jgi:hypothetical protein